MESEKENLLRDNLPAVQGQFPALDGVSPHYQRDCLFALPAEETGVHFELGVVMKLVHPGCFGDFTVICFRGFAPT